MTYRDVTGTVVKIREESAPNGLSCCVKQPVIVDSGHVLFQILNWI